MKLKNDFITRTIGTQQMMVAVGETGKTYFNMIKSNETAAFIVDRLKNETTEGEIVEAVLAEYEVDEKTAAADVKKVIEKLKSIGAIE